MANPSKLIKVRLAGVKDAKDCSTVLCASIRNLCIPDHHGDEDVIAGWIENKTPENLRSWIENSEAAIYVAEIEDQIVGVGGLSGSEVALNYVSPSHRGLGVSMVMLDKLESALRESGVNDAQLTSTATAHNFYLKAGWEDSGAPEESLGVIGFPMKKAL